MSGSECMYVYSFYSENGSSENEILGFWDFGILGFWDFGILGFWDFGILGFEKSRKRNLVQTSDFQEDLEQRHSEIRDCTF
jgi:hypothetical protein